MVSVGVEYRPYDRPAVATQLVEESIQESETAEMKSFIALIIELIMIALLCIWIHSVS